MALSRAIFEECLGAWQEHFSPEVRLRLGAVPLCTLSECTESLLAEVASRYLHADELGQWKGYRLQKRRTEWLGGRLAAKWAVAAFLGNSEAQWRTLVIRNEEDGRPYVTTACKGIAPFISISHSGPMAAALAANFPCGLDIQQPSAKIQTVKPRFASPDETEILNGSLPHSFSETEKLTMLWAAKEAVRKTVRVTPLLGFEEIRLLAGAAGRGTPQVPLQLRFTSGREQAPCPPTITALCFFADNLAWAMACPPTITKE